MSDKAIPVRVAVRIRPLVPREITEGSQPFINKCVSQPQVIIKGSNEAYTYDYVFGPDEGQTDVYESAVSKIVGKIFKGYNVTILAYGQTGSGKTFTMGTADTSSLVSQNSGIIQRAVRDLFERSQQTEDLCFEISVSFLELYMEKVYDLLAKSRNEEVDIREDPKFGIRINGLTETAVSSWEETLHCLEQGSHNRRTGATAMNHQSSRSHAVFTLTIQQIDKQNSTTLKTSKFHLVDLAGSERASKTQAVGERFAEGVNINKGLLALGNVISALCEGNPNRHIPYRDSKLTRLLQDSLGGNSHTLMIACVSPADSNYEETLSTLRYADRARKIKNKPIVNQDPAMVELMALRQQVQQLLAATSQGSTISSAEVIQLRQQLQFAEEEKGKLTSALQYALEENTNLQEKALLAEAANQEMKLRLEELQAHAEQTLEIMNQTNSDAGKENLNATRTLEQVMSLKTKIEEIQKVQRKGEIDLVNHELNSDTSGDDSNDQAMQLDEEKENDEDGQKRLSKLGADMALRQTALSHDLRELNAQLALKVHMVNKITQDHGPYSLVRAQYEAAVADLEKQVSALQHEKEELQNALASVNSNANACKISEQRRKRLQELEPQIAELRKKIQEQANIIKIKQRAEEQLKRFNSEIQSMKAQRVKLVRQMREENEKFRTWRQQKEREVTRLREQDRKRQGQIQKMEALHAKQQHVLRRKMEEAVAVNKRLKEALNLQSTKSATKSATSTNTTENEQRIKGWISSELDLLTSTKEAEKTLEELIESRRTLATRHAKLGAKIERGGDDSADLAALRSEMANIGADMDLRSEQIVELKQKIAAADLENKAKTRWDYVQTMVEAKMALKIVLDECVGARVQNFTSASEIADLRLELEEIQRQHNEALHELSNNEAEMEKMKHKHQSELSKLSRDCDQKLLTLMRQLPPCGLRDSADHKISEKDLLERLKLQQEELERCGQLQDQLNAALAEIEQLKRLQHVVNNVTAPLSKLPNKLKKSTKSSAELVNALTDEEEDFNSEYNSDDDPEWRQTPMFKRIKKLREEAGVPPKMSDPVGPEKKGKRMSRTSCACRTGGCKNCVCSKDKRPCGKECGCHSSGSCRNLANSSQPGDHVLEDQNRLMNETFDLGASAVPRKRSQASSKENSHDLGADDDDDDDRESPDIPWKRSRLALSNKLARKGGFFESN